MPENVSRRMFIKGVGGAAAMIRGAEATTFARPKKEWKIAAFGKPFQELPYDEAAAVLAEIGFDGIEATVRGKGQVLPENVKRDLPLLFKAVKGAGLEFTGMATHIQLADDEYTREILETAAGLGMKRYRMDYFRYSSGKSIMHQVDKFRQEAAKLAKLNAEIGIQGLYQNHAGNRLAGAALWDLDQILGDCDPDHLGVAFDLRHAKAEVEKNWPVGYRVIRRRIGMYYVKDFLWVEDKAKSVPLGEGIAGSEFYENLGTPKPVSLHIEYGNHQDPVEAAAGLKKDLAVLRGWLA